jgi:glycosyltransferase involved in cell wall biosynthesis
MSASHSEDAARNPFREYLKSRIVKLCDAGLVAGQKQFEYVVSLGMQKELITLGYDAVDNEHFFRGAEQARAQPQATRERLGLPRRYILASARFIPKKNLPRLVECYAMARKNIEDPPELVILGDGPERSRIEAAILAAGLSTQVHLVGFRPYDLLPAFYALSEGFVHVSTAEQWGLVINEAAASGLPLVVSSPCGAASELVRNDVNGWMVDPLDIDSISDALSQLMMLSEDCRLRMGAASRDIVANWGPDRFASGLIGACGLALAQRPKRLAVWDALLLRFLASIKVRSVA